MLQQIIDRLGLRPSAKVVRRSHHDSSLRGPELLCHHIVLDSFAHADADVIATVDDVAKHVVQ